VVNLPFPSFRNLVLSRVARSCRDSLTPYAIICGNAKTTVANLFNYPQGCSFQDLMTATIGIKKNDRAYEKSVSTEKRRDISICRGNANITDNLLLYILQANKINAKDKRWLSKLNHNKMNRLTVY